MPPHFGNPSPLASGSIPPKSTVFLTPFRPIFLSSTPPSPKRTKLFLSAVGTLTRRTSPFSLKPSALFSMKIPPGPPSSSAQASPLNPPIPRSPSSPPFHLPISPVTCRNLRSFSFPPATKVLGSPRQKPIHVAVQSLTLNHF